MREDSKTKSAASCNIADKVFSSAFSSDGRLVVTGGDTSVQLWNAATGDLHRAIAGCEYLFVLLSPTVLLSYQKHSSAAAMFITCALSREKGG
jgi:WD40 repeat protein